MNNNRNLLNRIYIYLKGKASESYVYNNIIDQYIQQRSSHVKFDPLQIVMVRPDAIESVAGALISGGPDSYHLEYIDRPVEFGRKSIGAVVGGDWDETGIKFEELSEYQSLERYYRNDISWEETALYQAHRKNIQNGTSSYGVRSVEKLNQRFEEIDLLFESISEQGVVSQREFRRGLLSEIGIALGRDGQPLFFGEGRHRLCIAKILDLDAIPALIHIRHKELLYGECEPK